MHWLSLSALTQRSQPLSVDVRRQMEASPPDGREDGTTTPLRNRSEKGFNAPMRATPLCPPFNHLLTNKQMAWTASHKGPDGRLPQGYWGPITSSLLWCEDKYRFSKYVAEVSGARG